MYILPPKMERRSANLTGQKSDTSLARQQVLQNLASLPSTRSIPCIASKPSVCTAHCSSLGLRASELRPAFRSVLLEPVMSAISSIRPAVLARHANNLRASADTPSHARAGSLLPSALPRNAVASSATRQSAPAHARSTRDCSTYAKRRGSKKDRDDAQDAGEPPAPAEETSPTGEADVASTSSASAEESATGDHSESAPGLPPSTLTLDFEGGSGKLVPSDESTASSPSPDVEVTSPAPDPEPASPPKVAPSPPSDGPRQRKAPTEAAGTGQDMGTMESQLLLTVAGLDRGLSASPSDQTAVDDMCRELERRAPPNIDYRADDTALMGNWRLVYSSAFATTGSFGGSRPGPPAFLSPFRLGQVFQRIRPKAQTLDNVVELILPGLPGQSPPVVQVCLRHDYEPAGRLTTRIVFTETTVRGTGEGILRDLPSLTIPTLPESLQPPRNLRSATFDNTYVSKTFRISRGDRGELRVYVLAGDPPLD